MISSPVIPRHTVPDHLLWAPRWVGQELYSSVHMKVMFFWTVDERQDKLLSNNFLFMSVLLIPQTSPPDLSEYCVFNKPPQMRLCASHVKDALPRIVKALTWEFEFLRRQTAAECSWGDAARMCGLNISEGEGSVFVVIRVAAFWAFWVRWPLAVEHSSPRKRVLQTCVLTPHIINLYCF